MKKKVIYYSSVCGQDRFDRAIKDGKVSNGYQNQKFHKLLLEGLSANDELDITVISFPSISRKEMVVGREEETISGVRYIYPGWLNLPVVRFLSEFFSAVFVSLKEVNSKSVLVVNVMNDMLSCAARVARVLFRNKSVGIVTDVPTITSKAQDRNTPGGRIYTSFQKVKLRLARKHDAYMLLTEAMNPVVNPKSRPYAVVEGFSDISMAGRDNELERKSFPLTLMYAGSIHRQYGIANLVEAFLSTNDGNWKLVIYGEGNFRAELEAICRNHPEIEFRSLAPNDEIVREEMAATILVNPRPVADEYVKYSFPSKTLEYMASGTPVVTTDLPGMPSDYRPHVFLFPDSSVDGLSAGLSSVMSKDPAELHSFGLSAKQFVLDKKNNMTQARRLSDLISKR